MFYWKAKEKTPLDSDAPWITMQPVGRNVLTTMVKKMCVLLLSAWVHVFWVHENISIHWTGWNVFVVNEIASNKQISVLLSVISPKTYILLCSLISLVLSQDKELVDALCCHSELQSVVIVEWFYFHCWNQASDESIGDYKAEIIRACPVLVATLWWQLEERCMSGRGFQFATVQFRFYSV